MTIDLDKLMKLHAESSQGEHVVHDVEGFGPSKTTIFVRGEAYPMIAIYSSVTGSRPQDRKNAEAAAAFHNAMPALIAEVLELRAKLAKVTVVHVDRVAPGVVDFETEAFLESKEPQWQQVGETTFAAPIGAFANLGQCPGCGGVVVGGPARCARCSEDSR